MKVGFAGYAWGVLVMSIGLLLFGMPSRAFLATIAALAVLSLVLGLFG